MYLNFTDYKLEKPNDCHLNYIDIYGNSLLETSRKERFCGTATEPHKSETNKVHIRLHAKPGALKFAFTILFTAFREPKNPGKLILVKVKSKLEKKLHIKMITS